MNFKTHAFLILFLFCSGISLKSSVFAQQITATLSLNNKEPRPLWFDYSRTDRGIVTVAPMSKQSKRNIGIYKYDENFKRQWVKQIFEQNYNSEIVNFAVIVDEIFLFVEEKTNNERFTTLYQYDIEGKKIADPMKILKLNPAQDFSPIKLKKSFHTKRFIAYSFRRQKPNIDFRFITFDHDTETFVEGQFDIQSDAENAEVQQVEISNQGNIIFLVKQQYGKGKLPSDNPYRLYKYFPTEKKLAEIPIKNYTYFLTDLTMKVDKNEDIYLGGFYSQKNSNSIIGTVYLRIDYQTHQLVMERYTPLDKAFLERYLTPKQISRGNELMDFYLDKMVLRSDGGIILFSERYYSTFSSYSSGFYTGYYYAPGMYYRDRVVYHYNDVALLSLNNEGEIEWTTIVEKRQVSEFPSQLSYFPVITPDKVFIFYKYAMRGVGTNIFFQTVQDGKVINPPKPLFPEFSSRDYFYRSSCEQISNNEAIMVVFKAKGKLFTFYKISF